MKISDSVETDKVQILKNVTKEVFRSIKSKMYIQILSKTQLQRNTTLCL